MVFPGPLIHILSLSTVFIQFIDYDKLYLCPRSHNVSKKRCWRTEDVAEREREQRPTNQRQKKRSQNPLAPLVQEAAQSQVFTEGALFGSWSFRSLSLGAFIQFEAGSFLLGIFKKIYIIGIIISGFLIQHYYWRVFMKFKTHHFYYRFQDKLVLSTLVLAHGTLQGLGPYKVLKGSQIGNFGFFFFGVRLAKSSTFSYALCKPSSPLLTWRSLDQRPTQPRKNEHEIASTNNSSECQIQERKNKYINQVRNMWISATSRYSLPFRMAFSLPSIYDY